MSRQHEEDDDQADALGRARPGALDQLRQQQQRQHQPSRSPRRTAPADDADDGARDATATASSSSSQEKNDPIRYFYAFYFSSLAVFVPFVSLYLRDASAARLTAAQVGAVAALRPLVSAPAGVLLAALADRRSLHRPLLVAGHALSAVSRAALVPLSRTLAGVVAATVASEVLGAPVCVIADATAVAAAGAMGYGSLRLWGALGWGGMSLFSGTILQRGGMGASALVYLLLAVPALWAAARMPCELVRKKEGVAAAAGAAADAAVSHGLGKGEAAVEEEEEEDDNGAGVRDAADAPKGTTSPPPPPTTTTTSPPTPPPTSVLALLHRDPGAVLFLATACLFGVGVGAIGEFLFLHLRDALQAPEWLMGATLAVTCAAEVPAFRLQPRLLRAIGVRAALRLVALAYVLRTALYAALPLAARALPPDFRRHAYFLVLPVEVLHGLCFACAWSTGTAHCRRAAPRGCEAELQAWFSGCFFGAGQATGCLVAGLLYARLGGAGMFGALSAGLAAGFLVLEALGARWPWAVLVVARQGGAGGREAAGGQAQQEGDDDEAGEGAWLIEASARWRALFRGREAGEGRSPAQPYRKLEHKNSDAEMALVGVGGGGGR